MCGVTERKESTYPNVLEKHAFDAFFHPEDNIAYVRESGLLDGYEPPEGIIICYQPQVLEYSRTVEDLDAATSKPTFRGMFTLPSTNHRVGVLGGFGFGSPVASLLMEDLLPLVRPSSFQSAPQEAFKQGAG
jgi:hypothetical protein